VMGTRGLGRFGRTFLGSLSAHVAAHDLASVAVPIETEYHPLP
jgi:nucleotide-binding universal stress UspA family protein